MSQEHRDDAPRALTVEEPSKAELQRQMEEARASISETVAEIKDVVTHQYEEVKDTYESVRDGVEEALDWREKFSENPIVWGAGAVSVGILIGLGLAQAFDDEGGGGHRRRSKAAGAAGSLVGELSGLADAMLPTISGKVKELFGLDLAAYIHGAREQAARKRATKRIGKGTKKAAPRKGAKTVGAKKSGAAKKTGSTKKSRAAKRGAKTRKAI